MEITLRSASEVPEIFTERLQARAVGERVLATTMAVDFRDNPVLDALVEYGLPEDILAADYFGHSSGPAARLFGHRGHRKAREEFEKDFRGSYVVLGEPPGPTQLDKYYQGKAVHRSHIKALAVGSKVMSLGGVNFINFAYGHHVDAMLDFESPEFVEFLADFIEEDGNLRDLNSPGESFALTDRSQVLVDYGEGRRSPIMESIYADLGVPHIRSVTMSSSYFPAGYLYSGLCKLANAGSEVTVYTNALTKFRKPHASMTERNMRRVELMAIGLNHLLGDNNQVDIVDCLPAGMFNHLKALIIRKNDASRVAYMGSHNFHPIAVLMGEADVALRTTEPELIDQFEAFIEANLAPSESRTPNRLFGLRDVVMPLSPL